MISSMMCRLLSRVLVVSIRVNDVPTTYGTALVVLSSGAYAAASLGQTDISNLVVFVVA